MPSYTQTFLTTALAHSLPRFPVLGVVTWRLQDCRCVGAYNFAEYPHKIIVFAGSIPLLRVVINWTGHRFSVGFKSEVCEGDSTVLRSVSYWCRTVGDKLGWKELPPYWYYFFCYHISWGSFGSSNAVVVQTLFSFPYYHSSCKTPWEKFTFHGICYDKWTKATATVIKDA